MDERAMLLLLTDAVETGFGTEDFSLFLYSLVRMHAPETVVELGTGTELLKFKYGEHSVSLISSLYTLFGVNNCLELDLVLLHDLPIIKRWQFSHLASDIVNALAESPHPGLYMLLTRFWVHSGTDHLVYCLPAEAGGGIRFG